MGGVLQERLDSPTCLGTGTCTQDVRPDGGEVFILAADGSIIAGAGSN